MGELDDNTENLRIKVALIQQDVKHIRDSLSEIKKIVFGFVGVLALAVLYGLINLIPGLSR